MKINILQVSFYMYIWSKLKAITALTDDLGELGMIREFSRQIIKLDSTSNKGNAKQLSNHKY